MSSQGVIINSELDPVTNQPVLKNLLQTDSAGSRKQLSLAHCGRVFHQAYEGRQREASGDRKFYDGSRQPNGDTGYVLRDLRHRLCGHCLEIVQPGDLSTKYTGEVNGILHDWLRNLPDAANTAWTMHSWSAEQVHEVEQIRRQDKNASKQRSIMASRASHTDAQDGSITILLHLSRAGNISIRWSQTLQQYVNSLDHEGRQKIEIYLDLASAPLRQLRDAREAAARSTSLQDSAGSQLLSHPFSQSLEVQKLAHQEQQACLAASHMQSSST